MTVVPPPPPSLDELLRYRPFVARLVQSLIADPHTAADVEQQSWLRVLRHPPAHGRAVEGWLARVVRSVVNTHLQSEGRRRGHHAAYEPRGRYAPPADRDLERRAVEQQLGSALGRLGPTYAETIRLRFYEDLSPPQIAERLGLPVETVRTRLKRGLAHLRASLDRAHPGGRREWCLALVLGHGARSPKPAFAATPAVVAFASLVGVLIVVLLATPGAPERDGRAGSNGALAAAERSVQPHVAPAIEPAARRELAPLRGARLLVRAVERGSGTPRPNVPLALERRGDALAEPVPGGRTDAEGVARFAGLAPGPWRLVPARGRPVPLWLEADEERELVCELDPGVDLDVLVLDPDGAPADAAEVWVSRPGAPDKVELLARTDELGRLRCDGLDPRAWIGARRAGLRSSFLRPVFAAASEEGPFVLSLLGTTELHGVVRDEHGAPLAGARLELRAPALPMPSITRDGQLQLPAPPPAATCDELGRFALPEAPLALTRVEVSRPGFEPRDLTLFLGRSAALARGTEPLEVVLSPAAAPRAERGTELAVVALDARGRPWRGARVLALDAGRERGPLSALRFDGWGAREGIADAAGELTLTLPPECGPQDVYLLGPEGALAPPLAVARCSPPLASPCRLRADAAPAAALEGLVLNAPAGVTLVLASADTLPVALAAPTDAHGRFRFERLPPGPCSLSFLSGATLTEDLCAVRLEAGGTTSLGPLRLPERGSVRLSLRTADGAPVVEEAFVSFSANGNHYRARPGLLTPRFRWEADGTLTVDDLLPGLHEFLVRGRDLEVQPVTVEVRPGETTEREVVLAGGSRLIVDVLGQGAPVTGCILDARAEVLLEQRAEFLAGKARMWFWLPPEAAFLRLVREGETYREVPIAFGATPDTPLSLALDALRTAPR